MKTINKLLTGAFCACLLAVGLTACEKEHVHAYEKTVTAPTCTEQGYTTYTCSCGESYVDDYVDELGHDFKHYVSDNNATFETNCTETAICNHSGCWATNEREIEGTTLDASLYFVVENGIIKKLTSYGMGNLYGEIKIPSVINGEKIVGIGELNKIDGFKGGDYAFTKLTACSSIIIPDGVTYIGNYAFSDCVSLTSITIPDSVTSIGYGVFSECSSLTSITVGANNANYKSIDGNLYTKDGPTLVRYAIGKTATTFTIPDGVTSISDYAFYNCSSLTSVVIGDSVTSIGYEAFYNCSSLTSVVIGDSVTSIGGYAFYGCSSLTIYCEAESKPSGWVNYWNRDEGTVYWYSENQPTTTGNYWHYGENGEIVVW